MKYSTCIVGLLEKEKGELAHLVSVNTDMIHSVDEVKNKVKVERDIRL